MGWLSPCPKRKPLPYFQHLGHAVNRFFLFSLPFSFPSSLVLFFFPLFFLHRLGPSLNTPSLCFSAAWTVWTHLKAFPSPIFSRSTGSIHLFLHARARTHSLTHSLTCMNWTQKTHTYQAPSCTRRTSRSTRGSMCPQMHRPWLQWVRRNESTRDGARLWACVRLQIRGASEKEKESGVSNTGCAAILLVGFIPAVRDVTNRGGGREDWWAGWQERMCVRMHMYIWLLAVYLNGIYLFLNDWFVVPPLFFLSLSDFV